MSAYHDTDLRMLLRVEREAQRLLGVAMRSRIESNIDTQRARLRAIRAALDARHPGWRETAC